MNIENIVRKSIIDMGVKEYAPDKQEKTHKFDLSLNINPFGVSDRVMDKIRSISPPVVNNYYAENQDLKIEISNYVGVKPEQVLLGDGCDGCIEMIAHTFIENGDEVLIPVPTFHRYEFHTDLMGGTPVFCEMNENFEIDAGKLLEKATDKTKIIFLCDPNNPTGLAIDDTIKENIIRRFHGIVVIDEALADTAGINGSKLVDKHDNLIVVRSFSKTFGIASLRVGYIISNEKIVREVKKTSSPFKVNGLAQEAALEALRDKDYIRKSKEFIDKEKNFLFDSLKTIGMKFTDTKTTNFLLDITPTGLSTSEFVDRLKEKNVIVTNATVFRVSEDKFVRVCISDHESNAKFIDVIREICGD
ncbi:MAG: histidinol-phosphate transaminase [Candidatus Aenigmatarchaeota archaeon]